ncbi:hypothetical protein [Streptomyces sp. NPDC055085]
MNIHPKSPMPHDWRPSPGDWIEHYATWGRGASQRVIAVEGDWVWVEWPNKNRARRVAMDKVFYLHEQAAD